MVLPLFFSDVCATSDTLTLDADASRHVGQVLRMKEGELLQLTDGKGNIVTSSIISPDKHACSVSVIKREKVLPAAGKVSMAVSLLKHPARFEWFLEKATELGVQEIFPLKCARTEKQQFRQERWNNILLSAMLQSRQAWLPQLHEPLELKEIISSSRQTHKFIAHCMEGKKETLPVGSNADVIILIGPEGDFTEEEVRLAESQGFRAVSLGSNRLRTETAAMTSAVLLCAGRG